MLKEGWTVKNAAKRPISKEHPEIFCSEVTGIFYKKSFRGRQVRGAEAHQQWITVHPFQSLSCVWLFATPWTAAHQASLSTTSYQSLLKLMHRVSDDIQPSHPLSSPSLPAFNLFHHQCLFQVSSLHQVAKVLELQHQSFQLIFRTDFL